MTSPQTVAPVALLPDEPPERIVCVIDDSPSACVAVAAACRLAETCEADLEVVTVRRFWRLARAAAAFAPESAVDLETNLDDDVLEALARAPAGLRLRVTRRRDGLTPAVQSELRRGGRALLVVGVALPQSAARRRRVLRRLAARAEVVATASV